jgi:outer membrane immunogenic protein
MNTKSRLLTTVAAAAMLMGFAMSGARAADIVVEPAAHDWSGFYAGAHVGYGEAFMDGELDGTAGPGDVLDAGKLDLSDVIGGGHLGYNAALGSVIVGVECDFTWVGLEDHVYTSGTVDNNDHINGSVDFLASVRARLGLAMDDLLIFVTGGVAFTEAEIAAHQHGNRDRAKFNDIGGVVGGGVEFFVARNVSVRGEGLYYFFGDDVDISDFHSGEDGQEFEFDDAFVLRVGASLYLFGHSDDVVAEPAADVLTEPAADDWSGFYFGAHVGYGEAYMDGELDTSGGNDDILDAGALNLNDVVGGVHLGYNAELGSVIVGVEGDFTWVGLEDHFDSDSGNTDDHIDGQVDFLASIRARLGLAMDDMLIYATGGVAFTEAKIDVDQHNNHDTAKFNDIGGVVGGGLELKVADNVSVRGEGLYYFFGDDQDVSDFHSGEPGDEYEFEDAFVLRVGTSFHLFGI